jgi:hypothetical protein
VPLVMVKYMHTEPSGAPDWFIVMLVDYLETVKCLYLLLAIYSKNGYTK